MSTTIKAAYTGQDYQKVGVLKDFLVNPLSTTDRTTLAGVLSSANTGLVVYDTDDLTLYIWTGSEFAANPTMQTGLTPKGNKHYNDTEPATPSVGDLYVFDTAGTNTWDGAGGGTGSTDVQIGDQVYWDGTSWQFIQGNIVASSETLAGIIEIATQAETNTGTDDARAVTPAKLSGWKSNKKIASVYFASGLSLTADTPLTVTHNLNLQNRNAFTWNFMSSNSSADVDVDSTSVNALTVTSSVSITGDICIIGF